VMIWVTADQPPLGTRTTSTALQKIAPLSEQTDALPHYEVPARSSMNKRRSIMLPPTSIQGGGRLQPYGPSVGPLGDRNRAEAG